MKIYFIRHSVTKYNELGKTNGQTIDDPLSEDGIRLTKEVAPTLAGKYDLIYASDLTRTRQTAEIISSALHIPVLLSPALREIHLGSLTGLSWKEMNEKAGFDILEIYKAQKYDFRPWGGESFADMQNRIDGFIDMVKKEQSGKRILVVTHGGVVRYMQYKYHNVLGQKVIDNLAVAEFEV